jgi:5-methyltetrahydropteroyltriglutamate--homocysteine methyltransferase
MKPPFRADHVGSLLRPEKLKQARSRFLGPQTPTSNLGPHDDARLREVEDECVREVIALQQRIGLRAVTDGDESGVTQGFSELNVVGKIRWQPSSVVRAFEFLQANTRALPKVTLPAPNCVHYYLGGKIADPDVFWDDLVAAYRRELDALVKAGARYIQLDDTSIAFICDPAHRELVRSWGIDPADLLHLYADKINAVLAQVPDEVAVTLHQCRGNREGNWAAEGGYDPVAEVLFNRIDVDGYFLEYDTARAGGFEPLRFLPKGKKRVALGLVSSKKPQLERKEDLMRGIEAASKFVPLEQLALGPQCGFASSIQGNPLGEAEQEAKLRRIVEVADHIWGNA